VERSNLNPQRSQTSGEGSESVIRGRIAENLYQIIPFIPLLLFQDKKIDYPVIKQNGDRLDEQRVANPKN
jgi:hypothetical protein